MIANLFHHDANNIGDQMCGPAQYLWPDLASHVAIGQEPPVSGKIIVGGGQIYGQLASLSQQLSFDQANGHPVVWGVGLPLKGRRDNLVRDTAKKFSLFGTRNYDWRDELDFTPCVSCMSPLFDQLPKPQHEVVIFAHRRKASNIATPDGVPMLTNRGLPAKQVLEFIAKGETVVTSSYHGVYWAQLLGRKVICVPYGEKFRTFQHLPTYAEPEDWQGIVRLASQTDPLLEQYRQLNLQFAKKVSKLWGLDE
ncbi:hypothetical protein [Roseovarius nanhaiticus]|uniref:hypothetical protein n=1 Tax=Roseovarius nanhaiticus TaxID=573024 RepID=UPI0024924DDB|nr:hypothetical protein [Roseovarius nanhaiticus]